MLKFYEIKDFKVKKDNKRYILVLNLISIVTVLLADQKLLKKKKKIEYFVKELTKFKSSRVNF